MLNFRCMTIECFDECGNTLNIDNAIDDDDPDGPIAYIETFGGVFLGSEDLERAILALQAIRDQYLQAHPQESPTEGE